MNTNTGDALKRMLDIIGEMEAKRITQVSVEALASAGFTDAEGVFKTFKYLLLSMDDQLRSLAGLLAMVKSREFVPAARLAEQLIDYIAHAHEYCVDCVVKGGLDNSIFGVNVQSNFLESDRIKTALAECRRLITRAH